MPLFPSVYRRRVVLASLFLLCSASASATQFPQQGVVEQREYAEWSVDNPSWSGHAFDVIATVTFSHEGGATVQTQMFFDGGSTWRWRFTGTQPGNWSFTTSSSDPDLDGHSGTVLVDADADADGFLTRGPGDKWMKGGTDRALVPNLVMLPGDPAAFDSDAEVDAFISEFIDGHGFTGFHVPSVAAYWFQFDANGDRFSNNTHLNSADTGPDPATFRALEKLIVATHAAGGVVHIWAWGDSSRHQTLATGYTSAMGGINGLVDQRLQRYIAARLGPLPGWTMGYGYDLFEWVSAAQLDAWHAFMHDHLGWFHFLGARGNKNEIVDSQISENMDYVGYEQHHYLYDFDDWVQTMTDRAGRPSFSEDRFRSEPSGAKNLDPAGDETRQLMWDLTMAGGIAAIWGYMIDSPGYYSTTYPNKEQLKLHDIFWNDQGYFRRDLERGNQYSQDGITRILVTPDRDFWVCYVRGSDRMQVDLASAPGDLQAVYVDTQASSYAEVALPDVPAANGTTITLPAQGEWAVVLKRDASDDQPPTPPTGLTATSSP